MSDRDKRRALLKAPESPADPATTTELSTERRSLTHSGRGQDVVVPRHCTLDGFAEESTRNDGVDVSRLEPLTVLQVQTQNTLYRITLLDPFSSEVLVHGGPFFTDPTRATLCGSSFGGSFLKSRWIGVGMRLEVSKEGRNIVTSPIRFFEIEEDSALPGPF